MTTNVEGGDVRVLHVDDDPEFIELTRTVLGRNFEGFEVVGCDSGEDALQRLRSEPIDCIVSDYDMGNKDGLDLLREVRAVDPEIPFLLFTGKGNEDVATEAIQRDVTGYLQKGGAEQVRMLGKQIETAVRAYDREHRRRERAKELSVLHDAALILVEDKPFESRMEEFIQTVPPGLQFPNKTAARLTLPCGTFETRGFEETDHVLVESVETTEGKTAELEVAYTGIWDTEGSPFEPEEAALLESLANILKSHLERVEVIEELERRNERFRTLLNNTPGLVYLKDADGCYSFVNDEYAEMFDTVEEAILENTAYDVHDNETARMVVRNDNAAYESGEVTETEEAFTVDGERRVFKTTRVPLFEAGEDDPYALLGIATDITEQKERIDNRENILDRITDGFVAVDTDGNLQFANERAEEMTGIDAESLVGKSLDDVFSECVLEEFEENYGEKLRNGETITYTTYSEAFETRFDIRVYPSESGASVYFREVDERARATPEIEAGLRALVEGCRIATDATADLDDRIRRLLDLGCEYLDLSAGCITRIDDGTQTFLEAVGDHPLIQPDISCPVSKTYCRRTVETTDVREIPDTVEAGWGDDPAYELFEAESYIGARITVDGEVYGTLCFLDEEPRDRPFTEREREFVELTRRWLETELVLRRQRRELQRRNESLDRFATAVTDDLKNPVSVAERRLEAVKRDHPDDENVAAAIESLETACERLDELRGAARSGRPVGDSTQVELDTTLESAWEVVASGETTLETDSPLPTIEGDATRLQQLFQSIISNARSHGGKTVAVGSLENADGFYIEDDGQTPSFDRPSDAKAGGSRSGIKLGIARSIAHAHGLDIRVVESERGGARFEFIKEESEAVAEAEPGVVIRGE